MTILDFIKGGPILFIGCHPDDVELGCGGLINRLRNKIPIYVLTLSKNQKNPKNQDLVKEQKESLTSLGISPSKIILGDFTTREFSYSRQKICDFLWEIDRKINPSCIFIPTSDLHQDHQVGNAESLRVFRTKTILEYYIIRSTTVYNPTVFVKLNKADLNAKTRALSKYKTYKDKNYFSKTAIPSMCQSAGIKLEIPICETFNPVSIVL